jgi:hypothetical protein
MIYNILGFVVSVGDKIHWEVKDSFWIKKLKTFETLGLDTKLARH